MRYADPKGTLSKVLGGFLAISCTAAAAATVDTMLDTGDLIDKIAEIERQKAELTACDASSMSMRELAEVTERLAELNRQQAELAKAKSQEFGQGMMWGLPATFLCAVATSLLLAPFF